MNVIRAAEEAFNAMPAEVRDRFGNDPGRFLEFANDVSNYEEALKMGLAIKRPEKAAVGPGSGLPEPSVVCIYFSYLIKFSSIGTRFYFIMACINFFFCNPLQRYLS